MIASKLRFGAALLATLIISGSENFSQQVSAPVLTIPLPKMLILVGDLVFYKTMNEVEKVALQIVDLHELYPEARIVLVGDICNEDGQTECYERLRQTALGPLLPLIYTVPGNHDYQAVKGTNQLSLFYTYLFNYGERGEGWQVFDWGGWAVMLLNTEVMGITNGALNPLGKKQMMWMERELHARYKNQCIITIYHRPMYSPGNNASPDWVKRIFNFSIAYGVDFFVTAHEHMFLKFVKMWPVTEKEFVVDPSYGIEGIGVGTGGAEAQWFNQRRLHNGEVAIFGTPGVSIMYLWPGRYEWKFVPIPSRRQPGPYPSGEGVCHDNPSGYVQQVFN